ncbi:methyl-directed repair DNA adenine methylase [Klebsiella pneumoniae]|nr:methyl-directed repair DNA adenine methylase [Klebsiella pneumoniae]
MIKSPIKWAGGKTRVMPQLLKHLPKADCLIEPFVGSGTVFMNTEYRRYVLCDSNRALINFFRVLTSDTERLIDTARRMFLDGNNEEQYYKRRALFNSMQWSDTGKADTALLYAALFLYLNRHCFNGIYRVNQMGDHNVPFGKYGAPYLPADEMRRFAEKANDTKAVFIDGDFRHTIPDVVQLVYDAVIYCDPPLHPGQRNRQLHCLRQAFYPGRSPRPGCNPARCSSPARHPRGDIQQRHPGNPRDLLRFQPPRLQRSPLCQRQKPRYGR